MKPTRLTPRFLEKVWGAHHLSPWFADSVQKTGEVWFEGDCEVPLLVKFLFTTERLSVQVHPGDDYARQHHDSNGKTEMWHILRTEPGAQIALGLKRALTPEELRRASESGAIEDELNWIDVQSGDTFFTPAGTIHAIGAGLALCEIQQRSDVTYRLYDYGRPRELHLDRGVEVSDCGAYRPQPPCPDALVRCGHFVTEEVRVPGAREWAALPGRVHLLIALEGSGTLGGEPYRAGEVWQIPAGEAAWDLVPETPSRFLKTYVPGE
jgi:mannose-6-phosphate isomerase